MDEIEEEEDSKHKLRMEEERQRDEADRLKDQNRINTDKQKADTE